VGSAFGATAERRAEPGRILSALSLELAAFSVKTIHNLHYQIESKLGVSNDIELTQLAMSWGSGKLRCSPQVTAG